jgi:hypothetical protein
MHPSSARRLILRKDLVASGGLSSASGASEWKKFHEGNDARLHGLDQAVGPLRARAGKSSGKRNFSSFESVSVDSG